MGRYITVRILPTEKIQAASEMTEVMKGLCPSTFCVPLLYKHSPLADSIVNEVHWHLAAVKHSGIETVWRYVLKIAYIIFGRDLVKKIKVQCERFRHLRKKTIIVRMGPISKYNVMIAPSFDGTHVDIFGPLKAYSMHHKRTIKIWLIVYHCIFTSTTSLKVMDDYST